MKNNEAILREALETMLTHMGMDEDDSNKLTFDQARHALSLPFEKADHVTVRVDAVDWLKKHYPALCLKSGLCERIGGRLYTRTVLDGSEYRKALIEIAGTSNLTATPTQFARHLQWMAADSAGVPRVASIEQAPDAAQGVGMEGQVRTEILLRNEIAELRACLDMVVDENSVEQCTCQRCGNTWVNSRQIKFPLNLRDPISAANILINEWGETPQDVDEWGNRASQALSHLTDELIKAYSELSAPLPPTAIKEPTDHIESMLASLRQYRDAADMPIRSDFNAACDRLDVLVSRLHSPANESAGGLDSGNECKPDDLLPLCEVAKLIADRFPNEPDDYAISIGHWKTHPDFGSPLKEFHADIRIDLGDWRKYCRP